MTAFELGLVIVSVVAFLAICFVIVVKIDRVISREVEREYELSQQRLDDAFAAIVNAKTPEEKIFRSNPANDGKPFHAKDK
jgi:hypothetical protein